MTAILLNHHIHARVYAFIGRTWQDTCRQAAHFCLTDLQKNWKLELPHLRTAAQKIAQAASEGNWKDVVVQYVDTDPDSVTFLYGGENHLSITSDTFTLTSTLTPATPLAEENLEKTLIALRIQLESPSDQNKHHDTTRAEERKTAVDTYKTHNHNLHFAHWQDPFRIEAIYHLGTQLFQTHANKETLEAVKDLLNVPDASCFNKQHWFVRLQEMQQHDLNVHNLKELHMEILGLASEHGTGMGFLLKLQPKTPTSLHTTQWVYGETLSEALENARKVTAQEPACHPEPFNQTPEGLAKGHP